ncbi:hypothetical protein C0431_03845 [bacterium]|nr:hypothetical protein [bacterium]
MLHNPETYEFLRIKEGLRTVLPLLKDPKSNSWWQQETNYLLGIKGIIDFLTEELTPWSDKKNRFIRDDELGFSEQELILLTNFVTAYESLLASVNQVGRFEFDLVKHPNWPDLLELASDLHTHLKRPLARDSVEVHYFRITLDSWNDKWTPGRDPELLEALEKIIDLYNPETYPVWYPRQPIAPVLSPLQLRNHYLDPDRQPDEDYLAFADDESHSVSIYLEEADCFFEFGLYQPTQNQIISLLNQLSHLHFEFHEWIGHDLRPYSQ